MLHWGHQRGVLHSSLACRRQSISMSLSKTSSFNIGTYTLKDGLGVGGNGIYLEFGTRLKISVKIEGKRPTLN